MKTSESLALSQVLCDYDLDLSFEKNLEMVESGDFSGCELYAYHSEEQVISIIKDLQHYTFKFIDDLESALEICQANLKDIPNDIHTKAMRDAVNEALKSVGRG